LQHDADEIVRRLNDAQVPGGKIYSVADIVKDPQFLAREMIRQARLPDGTPLKVPGVVPKLTETPGEIEWVGPKLGEHTDEILGRIGYSVSDVAALRAGKVV
jgi:formyl-CoA transferase